MLLLRVIKFCTFVLFFSTNQICLLFFYLILWQLVEFACYISHLSQQNLYLLFACYISAFCINWCLLPCSGSHSLGSIFPIQMSSVQPCPWRFTFTSFISWNTHTVINFTRFVSWNNHKIFNFTTFVSRNTHRIVFFQIFGFMFGSFPLFVFMSLIHL